MKNKSKLFPSAVLTLFFSSLLVSCGGGDDKQPTPELTGPDAFVAGTHPRFDPVISDIPFNTDLVFAKAAASDGTADVGAPSDPVRATVNGLDGFSTSAFFDVMVDGSVDASTVIAKQTVFLVELALKEGTTDALNPANIGGIANPQTASYDARVVSLDGGINNAIRIRPLLPLNPKTKYLVILTNDIKDSAGKRLTRSWTYNALRDTTYPTLDSLVPVRNAIVGWEALAVPYITPIDKMAREFTPKESIVLTYTFTTTDPQTGLVAMAAPRAALAKSQIDAGISAQTAVATAASLEAKTGIELSTPRQRPLKVSADTGIDLVNLNTKLAGDVAKLYTGYIKLPYYQTAPGNLPFGAFLTRAWQPDRTLYSILKSGAAYPTDVDAASYNVTYRFPFAVKTSDESIPLQVTLPKSGLVPSPNSSFTCGQIYGVSGYPVVIYVHGITSDRTSVLALAHSLAKACIATVSIDLPLHGVPAYNASAPSGRNPLALNVEKSQLFDFQKIYGVDAPHERHFNIAGSGGVPAVMSFDTPTSSDGSGAFFTNLGNLLNTRDNNREAVMDLLNLNASLKGLDTDFVQAQGAKLNLSNVNVVGHSLGGILGTVFTAVNQRAIANEAAFGLSSNLNPINSLTASVAGTQVAQVLVNSATFAPVINAGLAKAGVNVGTSNYEKFLYAAQSAVDAGDPVNFAKSLPALNVRVLLQQVKNDAVIPNSADVAPLTGTAALAKLLGATQIDETKTLGIGIVKLNAGDHASVLRPTNDAPLVTTEMQTEIVTFVSSSGTVMVGAAPQYVEDAP